MYMFPAQKCSLIKKVPHKPGSLSEKVYGRPSAATSHESRPGKPSFCILCLRTRQPRSGVEQITLIHRSSQALEIMS